MKKYIRIILPVLCLLVLLLAACDGNDSSKSNREVILNISGSVNSVTADSYEQSGYYKAGETISLHSTTVTVDDISKNDGVTLSFSPEVIDKENNEKISTVTLRYSDAINFKGISKPGESESAKIQVAGYK